MVLYLIFNAYCIAARLVYCVLVALAFSSQEVWNELDKGRKMVETDEGCGESGGGDFKFMTFKNHLFKNFPPSSSPLPTGFSND